MGWFNSANNKQCSIEIRPDGLSLAVSSNLESLEISSAEFFPYQNSTGRNFEQLKQYLYRAVLAGDLKGAACNWVLHPSYYRLTLINTPNVPRSEYKKAARWQIKDIIDYPLDDVAIDVFYQELSGSVPKKIYMVASQSSRLEEVATIIQECGLHLTAIDIREFALRNLLMIETKTPGSDDVFGILDVSDNSCVISLIKDRNIYFVRRFPIVSSKLGSEDYDDLILELKRSFEYCKGELKLEVANNLSVVSNKVLGMGLIKNINDGLGLQASYFHLSSQGAINFKVACAKEHEHRLHAAIGGVLRKIGGGR